MGLCNGQAVCLAKVRKWILIYRVSISYFIDLFANKTLWKIEVHSFARHLQYIQLFTEYLVCGNNPALWRWNSCFKSSNESIYCPLCLCLLYFLLQSPLPRHSTVTLTLVPIISLSVPSELTPCPIQTQRLPPNKNAMFKSFCISLFAYLYNKVVQ